MGDIFHSALRSLTRRFLRTLLTVGSIMVGVTMVVIVTAISACGKEAVNTELDNMGMSGLSVSAGDGAGLSEEDLAIIRQLAGVDTAMPLMIEYGSAALGGSSGSVVACGIDAGAKQAISLELKHGRLISPSDVKSHARVCVVDENVAQEYYQRTNIVGKTVQLHIGGVAEEFTVVGVTAAGSSLLQNVVEFIPGMVYVPYATLQSLTGRENFDQIAVRVGAQDDVERTEARIVSVLENETGLSGRYRTDNLAVQKERLSGLMDIVTLVLTVISGISLLVSGMGVMTVMLSSVSERTREIGIKKAIGATRGRIMGEFLAEAVVLSLIGSLIGIAFGCLAAWTGGAVLGVTVPISLNALLGLILFTVFTGAVFGVYPAFKAAQLRPVDALRTE